MESIWKKSEGDWFKQIELAKRMADLIELPGKAQARGNAAQVLFGQHSPVAAVFYERAFDLGGDNVEAEASVNPIDDVESAYEGIPEDELPGSRRENPNDYPVHAKTIKWFPLESLGRINLVRGSGPEFDPKIYQGGTLEVWKKDGTKQPKLIWTVFNYANNYIDAKQPFKIEDKKEVWTMIDYIDLKDCANLIPLYGKNLPIYSYS